MIDSNWQDNVVQCLGPVDFSLTPREDNIDVSVTPLAGADHYDIRYGSASKSFSSLIVDRELSDFEYSVPAIGSEVSRWMTVRGVQSGVRGWWAPEQSATTPDVIAPAAPVLSNPTALTSTTCRVDIVHGAGADRVESQILVLDGPGGSQVGSPVTVALGTSQVVLTVPINSDYRAVAQTRDEVPNWSDSSNEVDISPVPTTEPTIGVITLTPNYVNTLCELELDISDHGDYVIGNAVVEFKVGGFVRATSTLGTLTANWTPEDLETEAWTATVTYSGLDSFDSASYNLSYAANPGPAQTAFMADVASYTPSVFYKMDDASGTTANDSSGGGNHGTYANTYTLNQLSLFVDGASVFLNNGQVKTTSVYGIYWNTASVGMLFKTGSDVTTRQLLSHTSSADITMYIESSTVNVYFDRPGVALSGGTLVADTWYMVVVNGLRNTTGPDPDGHYYSLYVNDTLVDSDDATAYADRIVSVTGYHAIGRSQGTTQAKDTTGTGIGGGNGLINGYVKAYWAGESNMTAANVTALYALTGL